MPSMNQLSSFGFHGSDAGERLAEAISAHSASPSLVVVAVTETIHLKGVLAEVKARTAASTRVVGTTSSGGLFTEQGLFRSPAAGALSWTGGPHDDFGTACAALSADGDPRHVARDVANRACNDAGHPGETPDLVVLLSTPGCEEEVLQGIVDVVGQSVPVVGGSAADDTVGGRWSVGDPSCTAGSGVAVMVVFADTPPHVAHQSGYLPTGDRATVTRAEGRQIRELNGQSAVSVYDQWTGGLLARCRDQNGSVLQATTLWPLGRKVSEVAGQPIYALAHPAAEGEAGAIDLFADVEEGQEIVLMKGSPEALVSRAGLVARDAVSRGPSAGGLVIYCAGCSLAVGERLPEVPPQVARAFGGRPVFGWFTFGEQGPRLGDQINQHANLMISAISIPDRP